MSYQVTIACPGMRRLLLPGIPADTPEDAMGIALQRIPDNFRGKKGCEVIIQEQDNAGFNTGDPTVLKNQTLTA